MKKENILRVKVGKAKVEPSDKLWDKIEAGLQTDSRIRILKRRSIVGWAAALVIGVLAYVAGGKWMETPRYKPVTLELNDQAGEIDIPGINYQINSSTMNYRRDGRLIPNYRMLWNQPLIVRESIIN